MSSSDSDSDYKKKAPRRPVKPLKPERPIMRGHKTIDRATSKWDVDDSDQDYLSNTDDNKPQSRARADQHVEQRYYSDSDNDGGSDYDESHHSDKDIVPTHKPNTGGFNLPGADEEPKIYVLCGACASGKSHMLKYIMYVTGLRKQFKFGLCFTSTAFTGDYDYLPKKSVKEFDMDYLEEYVKHLREKIVAGKEKHGPQWKLANNFIIIDDSIGLVNNSGFFLNFIGTHRHTRTTVFLLSQLLTAARSVNTVVRANTSFAMCWPTSMKLAVDALFRSYGQMFDSYAEFKEKLDNCRKRKFSCLVFKNDPSYSTVDEAYCEIMAPASIPDFQLTF